MELGGPRLAREARQGAAPAEVGALTPGKLVDSSAIVMPPGASAPITSFMRRKKAMASRFSRPPCTFGTHSPAGRE